MPDVERIERFTFNGCRRLTRIAIPLKRDLFPFDQVYRKYTHFKGCDQLTTVDLVGEAHNKTVSSLHMESWRTEMKGETNRINQFLPNTPANDKTVAIKQWMESVIDKMDHYKAEHYRHVKEGITLLELALWKAKLDEEEDHAAERRTKKVKVDVESTRSEWRITSGANIVIKNVLPFLELK